MSLVLNTNIDSLIAQNSLTTSGNSLTTALQQLSSGLQINTAADNAAGYAIAQGMTSQINGLNTAINNANDGVSLTQTAQGALTEITNNLQTMRDLAVQSLNATNSAQDRADLNQQFNQLSADIQQVAQTASFNGVKLLDGSFSGQTFQIGANVGNTITVASVASMQTSALGAYTGVNEQNLAITNGAAGAFSVTAGSAGTISLGSNVATDASAVAAAINAGGVQGLTATANATSAVGTGAADTGSAGNVDTIAINGINISVTNTGNATSNVANAVSAINAVSADTGVSATSNGGGITLSASDGRNISATFTAGAGATASVAADYGMGTISGATAVVTTSTVNVNYVAPSGVSGSLSFTGGGLAGTGVAIGSTGNAVSTLSVTSVASSNTALTAIDQALQQVATTGAQLGAYQNRFQAAITGLQTDATNLSSAKSQIVDTNYAQATSDLSKNQILQQASTAMVAQANTIPQNILTLLQKLP
ncbi:MAG: flagellin [Proteobacteria bacterium]|nr:flagellin [Pseudomonadota bacterium]